MKWPLSGRVRVPAIRDVAAQTPATNNAVNFIFDGKIEFHEWEGTGKESAECFFINPDPASLVGGILVTVLADQEGNRRFALRAIARHTQSHQDMRWMLREHQADMGGFAYDPSSATAAHLQEYGFAAGEAPYDRVAVLMAGLSPEPDREEALRAAKSKTGHVFQTMATTDMISTNHAVGEAMVASICQRFSSLQNALPSHSPIQLAGK